MSLLKDAHKFTDEVIEFAEEIRSERVREALDGLTELQRLFIMHMAQGMGNATQCAIRAGYKPKNAGRQAAKLLRDDSITQAITLIELAIAAHWGVPPHLHREWLLEMSIKLQDKNPNAAIAARKLAMEMDGHIGHSNKGGSGITIVQVSTGIDRADISISHEPSVIEANQ